MVFSKLIAPANFEQEVNLFNDMQFYNNKNFEYNHSFDNNENYKTNPYSISQNQENNKQPDFIEEQDLILSSQRSVNNKRYRNYEICS